VRRELWLAHAGETALVVRDEFAALPAQAEIVHHWLGGHHLAWAFVDGWARLSENRRAVWFGTPAAKIAPASLTRHPGSRGPIAVAHQSKLDGTDGTRWWVFWCDDAGGWTPPQISVADTMLTLQTGRTGGRPLTFGP